MALAERARIPCTRRAAERSGLVVAWRRRRRFSWEVPIGREEPPHAIPPSAPAATPHALDPAPPLSSVFSFCSPHPPARQPPHERASDLYPLSILLYRSDYICSNVGELEPR